MSTKLERILWIDSEIRAGRYPNAYAVKNKFELSSVRTAYEDRRFMIDRLGAPIAYDREKRGWYYTEPSYVLPSMLVSREEMRAFFLGGELLKRYMGTPFERPLRDALNRMMHYLPENVSMDPSWCTGGIVFSGGATVEVDPELLSRLYKAMEDRKRVKMVYYTAGRDETNERTVDPYHMHNVNGNWYLIAYCHKRREVRSFLVGRIRSLEELEESFEIPADFSVRDYVESGFLTEHGRTVEEVVIKFDSYQARWIRERKWHPTQQIEELPDGGLILRLKTGGLGEIKRWVMGYGSHAEVLAPQSLRDEVKEEIEKAKKIYDRRAE